MKGTFVVLFALLMAGTIVFAFVGMESLQPPTYFLGLDSTAVRRPWEGYLKQSFQWYCEDNNWKCVVSEAGGSSAAQIAQCRWMISSGIKGLIVSAQDGEAARPILAAAAAAKIPVFTTDADIDSPNVKMYVGFSERRAGTELARKIVDHLRSTHHGQARGTVLEMIGPLDRASAFARSRGFHDVIDTYSGITVIQLAGDFL
ncbi:MAG TPA: substrate-binding domain-containing protein, partial [Spirochaetia bacterium]|nr:substrate-binding domain-containing protein [Spirochaetia bacterium]